MRAATPRSGSGLRSFLNVLGAIASGLTIIELCLAIQAALDPGNSFLGMVTQYDSTVQVLLFIMVTACVAWAMATPFLAFSQTTSAVTIKTAGGLLFALVISSLAMFLVCTAAQVFLGAPGTSPGPAVIAGSVVAGVIAIAATSMRLSDERAFDQADVKLIGGIQMGMLVVLIALVTLTAP